MLILEFQHSSITIVIFNVFTITICLFYLKSSCYKELHIHNICSFKYTALGAFYKDHPMDNFKFLFNPLSCFHSSIFFCPSSCSFSLSLLVVLFFLFHLKTFLKVYFCLNPPFKFFQILNKNFECRYSHCLHFLWLML